jgi:hypothetical protein
MIKLTYGQANALTSPVVINMFNNPEKSFPFVDAFKLSTLVSQLETSLAVYKKKVKELVEDCGGKILFNGQVIIEDEEGQKKFNETITAMNAEELEIVGEKVTVKADWPKLSLGETTILMPLIQPEEA